MHLWGSRWFCTPFLQLGDEMIPWPSESGVIALQLPEFCGKIYQFCDRRVPKVTWNAFCISFWVWFLPVILAKMVVSGSGPGYQNCLQSKKKKPKLLRPEKSHYSRPNPLLRDDVRWMKRALSLFLYPAIISVVGKSHQKHEYRQNNHTVDRLDFAYISLLSWSPGEALSNIVSVSIPAERRMWYTCTIGQRLLFFYPCDICSL